MRTTISARIPSRARRGRRGGQCAALLAAIVAVPTAASADGVLPAYGADVRVGDLRKQFESAIDAGPKTVSERWWTFKPSIDISESYDSAVLLPGARGRDYITRITPTFAGTVDTQRLKGALTYSPTYNLYAMHGKESGFTHNLNTNLTATLVPDLLFADLRGYAATQPLLGYAAPTVGTSGRVNEVQTTNFSAGPYLQKKFGDFAEFDAGYTISRTSSSSLAPGSGSTLASGANGNFSAQQETMSIASGPDFGRIKTSLAAVAAQYDGVGVYRGAHNETFTASAGYALTRTVTATGSLGHETIVYGPGGPKKIDGLTWSGGVVLTPNADSSITAKYGRQQGATSFSFDGSYAPSARLKLLARYSQGIGTNLQNLQSALSGTVSGPAGVAIDRSSGAPVQLGNLLNQQPGVYRTTIASVSGVYLLDRDVVTLNWSNSEYVLLSGGGGNGFGSNTTMTTSATWQHSISEAFTTSATLQYGTRTFPVLKGESTTTMISVSANYLLSETLSMNFLISHTITQGQTFGYAPVRDLAVVGLRKAF